MFTKIALVGNPNCGKTTLYNGITGSSQYVGNWPGVTVEKKEGKIKGHKDAVITDLPGVYSLSPYTPEEVVTRVYLLKEKPDVIINIIDATNLERNLYLTTQVLELGIPTIVALNMMDLMKDGGAVIDSAQLAKSLGCAVVPISALKNKGTEELINKALSLAKDNTKQAPTIKLSPDITAALNNIAELLQDSETQGNPLWYSLKVLERDEKIKAELNLSDDIANRAEEIINALENKYDDDSESIITGARYELIEDIVAQAVKKGPQARSTSDKIDAIVTNRFLALPIFAVVMFAVYYISVAWLGTIVTDWTNDTLFAGTIQPAVTSWLTAIGCADWLIGLIVDGCIGGVGAVLGFVPQMIILFILLSILEDCGYMARVAFIMDRIFRKFGLSGKSFIPMLISSGCGVPGVMSCKTIENDKDRRMTIMTTTFIPCGAKLPVIALIGGAMFPQISWLAPAIYFVGIAAVLLSGIMLKKTKLFAGEPAPFVMELPSYHIPAPKGVLLHMWERAKSFIIKAGTIIFLACGVIWFLSNFGFSTHGFGMVDTEISLLAVIGSFIAPIFAPLGFGDWQSSVATITGLVAKENVVATFGVLFGLGEVGEDSATLLSQIALLFPYGAAALSFLLFNMLCAPCFAAIGAIRREMASAKWTWFAIGYQTALAYSIAFLVNQIGGLLTGGLTFGVSSIIAFILLALLIFLLVRPAHKDTIAPSELIVNN